jgi:hypothetical protein
LRGDLGWQECKRRRNLNFRKEKQSKGFWNLAIGGANCVFEVWIFFNRVTGLKFQVKSRLPVSERIFEDWKALNFIAVDDFAGLFGFADEVFQSRRVVLETGTLLGGNLSVFCYVREKDLETMDISIP